MADSIQFEDRLRRVESRQNARVKELRRAFSDAAPNQKGEVAIEGMHLVEEAIRAGLRLGTVFFSESARERVHKLMPQLSLHTETLLLPDDAFSSAVPSETPQGVAAMVKVKIIQVGRSLLSATGVIGDLRRFAGSRKSRHHRAIGRRLWSHRATAWRADSQSMELEGGAGISGIDVSGTDSESWTRQCIAGCEGARRADFSHLVAQGHPHNAS